MILLMNRSRDNDGVDPLITEFLAANKLGAQLIWNGVFDNMCDFWHNDADQATAEVCLFDALDIIGGSPESSSLVSEMAEILPIFADGWR